MSLSTILENPVPSSFHKLNTSFLFSYYALFSTTIITFIGSLRTSNPIIQHILNLETAVSLVASLVYQHILSIWNSSAELTDLNNTYHQITQLRYVDWSITTPMLLLSFLLFLQYEFQLKSVPLFVIFIVVLLNYLMLYHGYVGEQKQNETDKFRYGIMAIFFFIMMIGVIWFFIFQPQPSISTVLYILYIGFVLIWGLYGYAYFLSIETKQIMYNVLDVISKSLFGVFCWIYFNKFVSSTLV